MKNFNLKIKLKNQLDFLSTSNNPQSSRMKSFCCMIIAIVFVIFSFQAKCQTCVGDITPPTITCSPLNINNTSGMCGANLSLVAPTASDNCSLIGNALHFDGANDKIIFPGSFPAYNNSALTLEAWIKSTNGGPGFPNSEIVLWDGGAGHSIVFRIANYTGNGGRLQFLIFDNNTVQFAEGPTHLNTNTWNHVAAVKNGNNVTLYLNGNIEASATITNGFVPAQFSIGGGGGASWDGTLDEVRIWHTARTQAQIQASMNMPVNAQPGLAALYHFDEGQTNGNNLSATTAYDASGNGLHGNLQNFALTGTTSNWVGGAIDNITNNAPATYPVGNTNVTWTATDASGNSATCTQVVTVTDTEAPIFQSGTGITDYIFSTASNEILEDMSSGATTIFGINVDDAGSAPIAMPFLFTYNGVVRTQFSVSSNGLIGFDNVAVPSDFSNSTNDNYPDVLYAYWDDLHTGTNGAVIYKVVGNAPNRKLVIQWQARSFSNDGGAGFTKTFQAWLYEGNNKIDYVFGNGTNSGTGGSTIGLRGANSTIFNEVTTATHTNSITIINDVNVIWPGAGRSYRFSLNSCPANITAYSVQGACDKNVSWTAPSPIDNCAIASLTSTHNPGDLFPIGTTTVVYTATDIHGNSSTCSFDVTVVDTNLFATCPQSITVSTDVFQCTADVAIQNPSFTSCTSITNLSWTQSGATINSSSVSGMNYLGTATFNKGLTTVTYTATNNYGHVSHCSFTIQVNDSIPPIITCTSLNVNNTPGLCSASVSLTAPIVSDNCSMAPNLALDFNGTPNYATLPPDVYFNGNFTIECWVYPKAFTNWSRIIDFGNGAASNNVLLAYTYQNSGRPGLYIQGTQIQSTATLPLNQWSHIAATFNSGTGTIYVNGLPAGSGTFPTPVNIVRNLNYIGRSNWGSAADPDANAIYDELRIWNIARTQSEIQAAMNSNLIGNETGLQVYYNFNQGIACGNNTSITQLQDLAAAGGTSNATLNSFTLNGGCTKNFTNGVAALDNGGLTNNAPPSYPVGTTNVVWTATDASGNTASCTQVVTVTDTEAPVFTQPSLLSVDFESGALPSAWTVTGLWHITSSCISGTPPNPTKWAYFGSDASCNFNVGNVTGSLSTAPISIPASAINPTLTFKSIYAGEGGTPYDLAALRVNGTQILNVSSSFPHNTWNTVSVNLSAYIGQTITIDWYFNSVDGIFNTSLGWQVDSISLQSSGGGCPSNITAYTLQGACNKDVSWTIPSPSDNCAIASLTSNYNPGDLFPVGTTTVVYTATDIHGNSSTCSFDVTVIDTNLFATCPQNITASTDAFQCAANLLLAVPTFTNCAPINSLTWVLSGATSASSAASGMNYLGTTTFNKGTTTVTYTATNSFGHVSHCSFTVQVNDSIPPTIICSPNLIVNHDEGVCGASVNLISPSISDNCPLNLLPNALNFDGVDDHVILPEFNLGTSDFTLETWINPTINSDDYLISNRTFEGGGCCNWFALSHQSDGKIYLEVASNGTPNYVSFGSNTAVPLNAWSHIAVVRSGLTMTIYINGVADVIYTDNFVRNVSTGNYVLLGGFPYYDAAWYQGSMDEVRIWNIARSGSQILNNMNSQIPAQYGLQNYYSMNQGIANSNNVGVNTAIDGSGNGYSGSLNNFALIGSTSNWVSGVISNLTNNAPSIFPIGTTNVVWTATDASGNSATCTQMVTVNPPSGNTTTTVCDNYTWIENNNAVYTVSGTYTQTFTTAYGCDSIHTLNLTVNYSSKTVTTISTIGCYTWPINGGTYTVSGMYTNTYTNGVGCLHTDSLYLTITPEVLLHAKAILQGPYDASVGLMHDSLRVQNAIPTLEPYTQLPYNKPAIGEPGGELLNLLLLTTTGNDAIVDWIFLELRDAINPSIIVATKRALIQRDGDIVSHVDGLSPIHFLNTSAGNYYVSIKHRNHLGVMSSTPIALSACAGSTINFSDLTPVYINPVIQNLPRKNLAGINALWSADANNNKNVKYNGALNDKDKIMTGVGGPGLINNIVYGYRVEDCNMDGKIRYNGLDNDRTLIITNVGVSTPNNVLFQHTPN